LRDPWGHSPRRPGDRPAAPATALHGARPGRPGFTPCRRLTAAVVDLRVTETDLRNRFQITLWTRPPRACSATWAGGLWLATSRGRGPGVTRVPGRAAGCSRARCGDRRS